MSNLYYTDPSGKQYEAKLPEEVPQPLDATGALATLLAVESVLTVQDAANAVGLTPQDLINEAEAWAVGS